MKFNALYGKHESLKDYPLEEGNLYITDKGYAYVDAQKENELKRINITGTTNWQATQSESGYVENRTHWRERDKKLIFAKTTDSIFEFDWLINNPAGSIFDYPDDYISLTPGKEYLITYNNKEYICKPWCHTQNYGDSLILLGDSRLLHQAEEDYGDYFDGMYDLHPEDTPFVISQWVMEEWNSSWAALRVGFDIYKQHPEDTVQVDELLNNIRYFLLEEPYFSDQILRTKDIPQYDWDATPSEKGHIQNRTHYREPEIDYCLQDIQFNGSYHTIMERGHWDDNLSYAAHVKIKLDKTYTVFVNGERYDNLTAWSHTDPHGGWYFAIGDSRQINAPDLDENGNPEWDDEIDDWKGSPDQSHPEDVPFLLLYVLNDDGGGGYYWFHELEFYSKTIDLYPIISVGIPLNTIEYHKIDYNYLPPWDWQAKPGEPGYIEGRTHWSEAETTLVLEETDKTIVGGGFWGMGEELETPIVDAGKQYVITVDGKKYTTTAYYDYGEGATCLGDSRLTESIYALYHPENVPFLISQFIAMESSNGTWYEVDILYPDSNSHTIQIEELTGDLVYHKLDIKYMPEDVMTKKIVDDFIGPDMTIKNQ